MSYDIYCEITGIVFHATFAILGIIIFRYIKNRLLRAVILTLLLIGYIIFAEYSLDYLRSLNVFTY